MPSNDKYFEAKFDFMQQAIIDLKEGQDNILKKLDSFDDRFVSRREYEAARADMLTKIEEQQKKVEELNFARLYWWWAIAIIAVVLAFFIPRIWDKIFQ